MSNTTPSSAHTYFIDHTRVGSINLGWRTRVEVQGTYQDAVTKAHEIWNALEKKTQVTVHSDKHCLYFWHTITANGVVSDRNTNSGVTYPASYNVAFTDNAYRAA